MLEQNTQTGQPWLDETNQESVFRTPSPDMNTPVGMIPQEYSAQSDIVPAKQDIPLETEVQQNESRIIRESEKPPIDFEKLGIAKAELQKTNLRGAEVVRRQYFSHQRDCMVTIRPNGIQFNNACISKFADVNYILLLIIRETKQLIVTFAEEDDLESQRWCNEKSGKRVSRKLTGRPFADRLYSMMGWSKGWYYQICGSFSIDADDENHLVMVFNLEDYEQKAMSAKTRRNHGVDDDTELTEEELQELKDAEEQKAAEKAARKAAKEAGEPMPVKKTAENFPEHWDKDSFGTTYADYRPREILPLLKDAIQSGEAEVLSLK